MIITVSRQFGAGGGDVARQVAARLGWRLVDNELVERVAQRAGLSPEQVAEREERAPGFLERLAWALASASAEFAAPTGEAPPELEERDLVRVTENVVRELAREGRVVLVGRGAAAVLATQEGTLHVKVVAPVADRVTRVRERFGVSAEEAQAQVEETDARRARYHQEYYRRDWNDPANYHVVCNTAALGLDGAADLIVREAGRRGWARRRTGG